jgi:amino acid transporter
MTALIKRIPRNAALLVFLLVLVILSPSIEENLSGFVFELMFDAVLVAGVYSVGASKHRWPFLVLTVVALAVRWGQHLAGVPALDTGALFVTVLWLVYTIALLVAHMFQRRDVSVDTILGSIVVYLLIAVAFTLTFEIIELQNPGSFSGLPDSSPTNRSDLSGAMMYFSLVCISTMGFGDIAPLSDIARPVAVLEGVTGQLYLAVMIARLVGLHIAGARDD